MWTRKHIGVLYKRHVCNNAYVSRLSFLVCYLHQSSTSSHDNSEKMRTISIFCTSKKYTDFSRIDIQLKKIP